MGSECADKIVMELIYEDFGELKGLLDRLSEELIHKNLVKRSLGYKLGKSVEELKTGDVDIWGDGVLVYVLCNLNRN